MLKWTGQEEDILVELLEKGVSVKVIARVLRNRSESSIYTKMRIMGIGRNPGEAEIDTELLEQLRN